MEISLFSATGDKKGSLTLPSAIFEAPVNHGLMHQAVVMQQGNRRSPIAHAKSRSEVQGSTKKLYGQKHTGRARRGSIRSPLLRGGGKAFGPKSNANFTRHMPQSMRHAALRSCLSYRAKQGAIMGLESYPQTLKTKEAHALLGKLSVDHGRRTLVVMPAAHRELSLSMRNIPGVKTLLASYLNPEDLLGARHIILLAEAVPVIEKLFGKEKERKAASTSPSVIEGEAAPAKAPKRKSASAARKTKPAAAKKSARSTPSA